MSTERRPKPRESLGPQGLLGLCVLLGVGAFGATLAAGDALRAWQAYRINFLFWTGLAFAGVIISAVLRMTDSRWGFAVRRLGECSAAFLPISLVLYAGVVAGHGTLAPDVHRLAHAKQLWLAPTGLLVRDGLALFGLAVLALAYLYFSLRPDLGPAGAGSAAVQDGWRAWVVRGWRGAEAEAKRARRATAFLAPILVIAYALVFTLLAVDQVMGLDPTWISTLFGAYFFITNLYLGWAALAVAAAYARRNDWGGLRAAIDDDVLHSLGKLVFAFCFLSLDFFWSQFLVIWYGNLAEETPFVLRRIHAEPWRGVALAVLLYGFALPFVLLLFRRIKRHAGALLLVALTAIIGLWIERFLLIAPSVWNGDGLPLGFVELGITAGFFGLAGLAYRWAVRQVPLLPSAAVRAAVDAADAAAAPDAATGAGEGAGG